jgi:hypothetical protein
LEVSTAAFVDMGASETSLIGLVSVLDACVEVEVAGAGMVTSTAGDAVGTSVFGWVGVEQD